MSELLDNREHRIRTLKEVIRHLHDGRAPAEVKGRLAQLVRECSASEIASMEQALIADGVPAQQIMRMCDLHAQVVRDILVTPREASVPPGHPVDTFRRENAALAEQVRTLRAGLATLAPADAADGAPVETSQVLECRRLFNELMDIDTHYQRKEHLLFSCLERHGITGPSTVMWGKDDEVRALLKRLGAVLSHGDGTAGEWRTVTETVAEPALRAVEEMIFKEERILLPMSLENLTASEWAEVWSQSPQFGYCLLDPQEGYEPPSTTGEARESPTAEGPRIRVTIASGPFVAGSTPAPLTSRPAVHAGTTAARSGLPADDTRVPAAPAALGSGALVFPTGSLSLAQLRAIFSTLPVDITFVDADDRVRFFSEGRNRVFARAKAVIGRRVQHCHPPSSVGMVDRILDDFRAGRQDVAEFWLDFRGRFVHIRYFAVRDEKDTYLGTLEVTQDLTRERALQGERRLLRYES
jgi:DUF438 domain-containing protein